MMDKYVLVVLTNPVAGREEEFNSWYNNQHVPDVLKIPGFRSAQRFKLAQPDGSPYKYLALYEVETDDLARTLGELPARAGGPDMVLSESFDINQASAVPWLAISEKISAVK